MKKQALMLALVFGMSLLGAREAVCGNPPSRYVPRFKPPRTKVNKPQRTTATRNPSIDDNLIAVTDDLQELLAIFGPYNPGPTLPFPTPGPTFPEPEDDDLMIEALINIMLGDQYRPGYYDYDVTGSASTDPGPEPKGPDGGPFCPEDFPEWEIHEKEGLLPPKDNPEWRRD